MNSRAHQSASQELRVLLFGSEGSRLSDAALAAVSQSPAATVVGCAHSNVEGPGTEPDSPVTSEWIRGLEPDLLLSAGYGKILPAHILDIPRIGAINLHPSLLPSYRGSWPIFWAFYEGQSEIGVTLHEMTPEVDAGGIIRQRRLAVAQLSDPAAAYDEVVVIGQTALVESLEEIAATRQITAVPQPPGGSFRGPPSRELDRLALDWTQPATTIVRQVRAFPSWVHVQAAGGRVFVKDAALAGRAPSRIESGRVVRRAIDGATVCAGDGCLVRLRGLRRRQDERGATSRAHSVLLALRLPAVL